MVATGLVQREDAWFIVVATGLVQPGGAILLWLQQV